MKVVFSDRARQDLTYIGDYIARENPRRAVTFIKALREMALKLSEMPILFPILPRYAHRGIRRRIYGNYLIFYRVDQKQVFIIRILHGARDYDLLIGIVD